MLMPFSTRTSSFQKATKVPNRDLNEHIESVYIGIGGHVLRCVFRWTLEENKLEVSGYHSNCYSP